MESDRLNRWLTLGANVAVLVGIVLLIYELQQNREMMRAQTRNEISSRLVDIQMTVASSPQLADTLVRGRSGDELSPAEQLQFANRNVAMYRYWENVHYQYRLGLYDEEEFTSQRDAWRNYVNSSKPVAEIWCRIRETSSAEYVAEVDPLLTEYTCD